MKGNKFIGTIGDKPIERTNALTLRSDSKNFLKAAKDLNKIYDTKKISKPVYFLTLRSIELGFKSLLKFHEGIPTKKLKQEYKHKLTKTMTHCIDKGYISLTKECVEAISLIDKYYENKGLEYTRIGLTTFPHLEILFLASEDINKELEKLMKDINTKRFL